MSNKYQLHVVKDASMISNLLKAETDLISKRLARQEERFLRLKYIDNQHKINDSNNEINYKLTSFIDLSKSTEDLLADPKHLLDGYQTCFEQYNNSLNSIKLLQDTQFITQQEIEILKNKNEDLNSSKTISEKQNFELKTKISRLNHSYKQIQQDYCLSLHRMVIFENILQFKSINIEETLAEMENNLPNMFQKLYSLNSKNLSFLLDSYNEILKSTEKSIPNNILLLSLIERVKLLKDNEFEISQRDFFNSQIESLQVQIDELTIKNSSLLDAKKTENTTLIRSTSPSSKSVDFVVERLNKDLIIAENQIGTLKSEKRQLNSEINKLKMTIIELECERDSLRRKFERINR